MALLTRAQIDAAEDLKGEVVEVPEWGGSVFVRVLTVGQRLRIEEKSESEASSVVRLVALSLCGDDGLPLFGEEGIDALKAKSTSAFLRVRDAALKVNRLTAGDLEVLEKN